MLTCNHPTAGSGGCRGLPSLRRFAESGPSRLLRLPRTLIVDAREVPAGKLDLTRRCVG